MENSDLDERFEVWNALSEFFLDTELDSNDYERIATTLSDSTYSIEEIEAILKFEVYPACKWNLLSVAGEWAGFHPDWIMENIAPRKDKRPRFSFGPVFKWQYRHHWLEVSVKIKQKREV